MGEDTQMLYTEKRIDAIENNIKEMHSSELQFYSIFITAILGLIVVVSGGFIYFSNRSADKKHRHRQQRLKNQIETQKIEIDGAKKYIDEQKGYIDKIVKEQEFYHFEIFDSLFSYYLNRIKEKNENPDYEYLIFASCALLYAVIAMKNTQSEQYITGYQRSIDSLITDYNAKLQYLFEIDYQFDNTVKRTIEQNIDNSIKECDRMTHSKSNEIKLLINNIIPFNR